MGNSSRLTIAAAAGLLLSACSAQKSVYWPALVNAPLHGGAGDKKVGIHGSFIQGQAGASWAVGDHVAVRAAADIAANTQSGDLGIGFYGAQRGADGKAAASGFRWGVSADVGTGSAQTFLASNRIAIEEEGVTSDWKKTEFQTDFVRAAVQAEAGRVTPDFEFALVLRVTGIAGEVRETAHRKVTGSELETFEVTRDIEWRAIEPACVVRKRIGGGALFEFQLGASAMNGRYADEYADAEVLWPFILAAGFGFDF